MFVELEDLAGVAKSAACLSACLNRSRRCIFRQIQIPGCSTCAFIWAAVRARARGRMVCALVWSGVRPGARAHDLCARVVGCTAGCWLAYCLPARSIGKSSQLVVIPTADGLIPTADGYGWNVASASTCVSSWPDESEAKTPIAAMAASSMVRYPSRVRSCQVPMVPW